MKEAFYGGKEEARENADRKGKMVCKRYLDEDSRYLFYCHFSGNDGK